MKDFCCTVETTAHSDRGIMIIIMIIIMMTMMMMIIIMITTIPIENIKCQTHSDDLGWQHDDWDLFLTMTLATWRSTWRHIPPQSLDVCTSSLSQTGRWKDIYHLSCIGIPTVQIACCKDNHNHHLNFKLMEIVPKKRATPSEGGWLARRGCHLDENSRVMGELVPKPLTPSSSPVSSSSSSLSDVRSGDQDQDQGLGSRITRTLFHCFLYYHMCLKFGCIFHLVLVHVHRWY